MDDISLKIKELKDPGEVSAYLKRPGAEAGNALKAVEAILSGIAERGDAALFEFIAKYDGYSADEGNLRVEAGEISEAAETVRKNNPELAEALEVSRKNIEAYHRAQYERIGKSWISESGAGKKVGQKVTPLERAGLYIPGGRYAYPPPLIMTAVPAKIAGVGEIAVCSPPGKDGKLDPVILYLCSMLGIDEVYRMGGAQAVAALAYGTETVKKVDKIAGPGNIYVTLAKKLVFGTVGIDSLAGPSDIAVIADKSARPDYIAADMLSQAEHDPLSRSILLSADMDVARETVKNIGSMLDPAGSEQYAGNIKVMLESVRNSCLIFYSEDMDMLVKAVNIIAPEHLEIMVESSQDVLDGIRNAGAIFLGDYTPVAVGDYVGGTNHVIPTEGNARFSSPLGVGDFLKRSSICSYSKAALEAEKEYIMRIAGFEKLYAHRASVEKRFGK